MINREKRCPWEIKTFDGTIIKISQRAYDEIFNCQSDGTKIIYFEDKSCLAISSISAINPNPHYLNIPEIAKAKAFNEVKSRWIEAKNSGKFDSMFEGGGCNWSFTDYVKKYPEESQVMIERETIRIKQQLELERDLEEEGGQL